MLGDCAVALHSALCVCAVSWVSSRGELCDCAVRQLGGLAARTELGGCAGLRVAARYARGLHRVLGGCAVALRSALCVCAVSWVTAR